MLNDEQRAEIEKHLPLVAQAAEYYHLKFSGQKLGTSKLNDLQSAGCWGLIDGVTRGNKENKGFKQYLRTRIKGSIIDFVRDQYWDNRRNLAPDKHTTRTCLFSDFEDYRIDAVKADTEIDTTVQQNLDIERFEAAFKKLKPRYRMILNLVYGRDMDSETVARLLGISPPRITQLVNKTIKILAKKMEVNK